MCEKECVAIAKMEMSGTTWGLRDTRTHTREWAQTTKRVAVTEGPMRIAKKKMSGICNHAAVNTHTRAGRGDETVDNLPDDGLM